MQSINLIPQQEVQEQTQTKVVKLSSIVTVIVCVLVAIISGLIIYQQVQINNEISAVNAEVDTLRQSIVSKAAVEVVARNLDKKYSTIQGIFSSRNVFSRLASEVASRTPNGVVLESFTLQKGGVINLAGSADNYISIATFTNNLLDKNFAGGDPTLKDLFTSVTLNSVSLEKSINSVRFSINVNINNDALRRNN